MPNLAGRALFYFDLQSLGAFSMVLFSMASIPVSSTEFHLWTNIRALNHEFHPRPYVPPRPRAQTSVLGGLVLIHWQSATMILRAPSTLKDITVHTKPRSIAKGNAEDGTRGYTKTCSNICFHSLGNTCPHRDLSRILPTFYSPCTFFFYVRNDHWSPPGRSNLMTRAPST